MLLVCGQGGGQREELIVQVRYIKILVWEVIEEFVVLFDKILIKFRMLLVEQINCYRDFN